MKPFRRRPMWSFLMAALLGTQTASAAITLDLTSTDSIKQASSTVASDLMSIYVGNQPGQIPGNLPAPYYWWEAGAFCGVMIDYWYFTGDTQYNDAIMQAMLWQVGPDNDYMPPNQTKTEGNDDQAFWGMAALSAAEQRFPNPPEGSPQWLALAQAVFNLQAGRWDTTSCAGGLKWQIFPFNTGYNYKNTISNGGFFNMASRLAVYTGNQSYADWADKMWDWCYNIGLISPDYQIFDGSDDTINCTQVDHIKWTYNAGIFLLGAANMYNYTGGAQIWTDRVNGIISQLGYYFNNGIMMETYCEPTVSCNYDQRSFKAYLSRWIAATVVRAPFTYGQLMPLIQNSAVAAAKVCTGGVDGNQCGMQWTTGTFDGSVGPGEQMSALSVIQSNLALAVPGPVTAHTGGTSKGNPSAGTGGSVGPTGLYTSLITSADKAGAGILTALVIIAFIGGAWWMIA